ncbi:MAG: DUF3142 domain-containing protein [Dokdonella sp.]
MIRRSVVGALVFLLALSPIGTAASASTDEAYVWQRQWSPALREALVASRDVFGGLRVLVAQAGREGRWVETQADPKAFAGDARARVAVVRYDGAGTPPDIRQLGAYLDGLLDRWRSQGAAFGAVEIDYDCANARLVDYAARLRSLRAMLPRDVRLSITALPAWLASPDLDAVLAASDEAVLQVHAVRNPVHGLFDAESAERWTRAFALRTRNSFRIALPTYGARVGLDAGGRVGAVESEMKVDAAADDDARELETDPRAVVDFLAHLRAAPPAHWQGVVWFRLPLPGDQRAWTLDALREVIAGRIPNAHIDIDLRLRDNGATDIVAVNRGGMAVEPTSFRIVGDACTAYDASAGWSVDATRAGQPRYIPAVSLRVAPGRSRAVGWVRCANRPHIVIDPQQAGKTTS